MGLVRGMGFTLARFFAPKATVRWPEQPADVAPKFRGRLQLLYDEYGTLKCETCFQCAQACPIECIDMGGMDTKGRFHVHWGPPETYGERREESALRRSGRPVPDAAFARFDPVDTAVLDDILERHDYDPKALLADPRGDAGRVRLPAGRRAQAHLADHGHVVRDDLRHRDLLPPPPVRAAGHRGGTGGAGPPRRSSPPTAPRWMRRSATARRAADDRVPVHAARLAGGPHRQGRGARGRSRRPGPRDAARARSRACGSPCATWAPPGRSRPSPPPGSAAGAGPASQPARSGAPRPPVPAGQRYVVANGYGADPGVQTDATLLRADPWLVLEGLAIAAFATGATEAILAVRADDTALVTRLEGAALAAEEAGFLGDNVLNSGHRVNVDGPARPGRVHAGRGDGPAEGARGQARPARAEAALPDRGRPVRPADRRQQRPDAGRRPVDRAPGRRGVRGDRRPGRPGHDPRPAPRAGRGRHRRGPARDDPPPAGPPRGRTRDRTG